MTAGDYTHWKCPICNHYLQRKKIKKGTGNQLFPQKEGEELERFEETHEILFCSVCHYTCKEPNPDKDIDEIVLPEYLKRYAREGASGTDDHLRCSKCLIRYKFGLVRTDKRMGAALYDDPIMEWHRCNLEEEHPGNHIATEETPTGIIRYEWSDKSDVTSSKI